MKFEVNEKFVGASLTNDEEVLALIAMESLDEIKKYSLVSSDLDINKWKLECYVDEEDVESDEEIEVDSDYTEYDSDDIESDDLESDYENSDSEYI